MKYITILFVLVSTTILRAEIGCMTKSKHLESAFDYKNYHYVQCNCPCWKYETSSDRGICSQCGHYHEPRRFEILHITQDEKEEKEMG